MPLLLEEVTPLLLPLLEEVTPLLLAAPLDELMKPLELPLPLLLPTALPLMVFVVASGTPPLGEPAGELLHCRIANGVASATVNPSIQLLLRIIDVLLGAVVGARVPAPTAES